LPSRSRSIATGLRRSLYDQKKFPAVTKHIPETKLWRIGQKIKRSKGCLYHGEKRQACSLLLGGFLDPHRLAPSRRVSDCHGRPWLCYTMVALRMQPRLIRAVFIGGAVASPQAQVYGLLVLEVIALLVFAKLRLFEGRPNLALAAWTLGTSKILTTGLSVAFSPTMRVTPCSCHGNGHENNSCARAFGHWTRDLGGTWGYILGHVADKHHSS